MKIYRFLIRNFVSILLSFLLLVMSMGVLMAQSNSNDDGMGQAEVNKVINEVFRFEDIRQDNVKPQPAEKGQILSQYDALRTEENARAELLFGDGSLARVGSDAYFSFSASEREVQMGKGTALFQVPKGSDETEVKTAAATASLTGTTLFIESNLPSQFEGFQENAITSEDVNDEFAQNNTKTSDKFILAEGSATLSKTGRAGESRNLEAGEMVVIPEDAERIPEPVNVDLQELMNTSDLVNGFEEEEQQDDSEDEQSKNTGLEDESMSSGESQEEADASEKNIDQTQESEDNQISDPNDESGGLDLEPIASSIDEQEYKIESGELERTDMVIDGEGTEMSLVEAEDEEQINQTTQISEKDAVEQKESTQQDELTSLTLDDQSELDVSSSTLVSTDETTMNDAQNQSGLSSVSISPFLSSFAQGSDVGKFEEDKIVFDAMPSFVNTGTIQDVVFVSGSTLDLNLNEILLDGTLQSFSLVSQADGYNWQIPSVTSTGTDMGVLAAGSNSHLKLNSIDMGLAFFQGISRGDLTVNQESLQSTGGLILGAGGNLTVKSKADIINNQTVQLISEGGDASALQVNSEVDLSAQALALAALQGGITAGSTSGPQTTMTASGGSITLFSGLESGVGSIDLRNVNSEAQNLSMVSGVGNANLSIQDSLLTASSAGNSAGSLSLQGNVDASNSTIKSSHSLSISSQSTSGPSIEIRDSTQLKTLSEFEKIRLKTNGGNVKLSNARVGYSSGNGFSRLGGTIRIDTTNPDEDGNIQMNGGVTDFSTGNETMIASTIKARAEGANGKITLDGSFLKAGNKVKLYAPGSNSMIRFTSDSQILGSTGLSEPISVIMSANSIQVDPGVELTINDGNFNTFYADNHKYEELDTSSVPDCGGSPCGKVLNQSGNLANPDQAAQGNAPPFDPQ